eukprot:COSAG01_NODE_37297_length_505_cov_1.130542_1_plen_28_part_10
MCHASNQWRTDPSAGRVSFDNVREYSTH